MTLKVLSKTNRFVQVESGSQNQGWNRPDPYGPITREYFIENVRLETNSISSNTLFTKKKVLVPYRPKSKKAVFPPTAPVLRLPQRPILSNRRPNQAKRSWQRAVERFDQKLKRYNALAEIKRVKYAQSLKRYDRRMAIYIEHLKRVANGVERTVRVKTEEVRNLPWNPYSRSVRYYSPYQGTYRMDRKILVGWPQFWIDEWTTITGYMEDFSLGPPNLSNPLLSECVSNANTAANSKALTRLHSRIGEQSVHIGNIIAERQQTFELIQTNLKRLIKLVAGFSWKRLWGDTVELLSVSSNKKAANATLEFLFGAKPLINDIYSAIEVIRNDKNGDSVLVIKGSSKSVDNVEFVNSYSTSSVGQWNEEIETIKSRVEVKVAYVLQYRVASGLASTLQQWGLVNPAEILWEKMPWSFVIDWVLPVGNWIRSFTSDVGLDYVQGSKVTTTTIFSQANRVHNSTTQANWIDGKIHGEWNATVTTQTKVREILSQPPSYPPPRFKTPVSVYHIIESLALLRQQMRR